MVLSLIWAEGKRSVFCHSSRLSARFFSATDVAMHAPRKPGTFPAFFIRIRLPIGTVGAFDQSKMRRMTFAKVGYN